MGVKIGNMVNLFVKNIMNTKEEEVYSNHTGSNPVSDYKMQGSALMNLEGFRENLREINK